MILNLYFFRVEIIASRSRFTRREIREEVTRIAQTRNKLAAIKRYRELMKPMPTLHEAKAFVDSIPPFSPVHAPTLPHPPKAPNPTKEG